MESLQYTSIKPVPWEDKETIKLGPNFSIKWFRFSELPFNKIKA